MAPLTDFERYGLAGRPLPTADRAWLLTIDFEAFRPDRIDPWLHAMRTWSSLSTPGNWQCSIFIAVEDVVRLRAERRDMYGRFLTAASALFEAGATFHPHNHGVFDPRNGATAVDRPQRVEGYRKRASFAYDVVHRHGQDLTRWLAQVVDHYEQFLADAGLPRPRRLAFRAGGWDHGDTAEASRAYVRALEQNGFAFDSSASSGVFGTRSWRVGAPYGSNVFPLSPSLVEVAPCWAFNSDASRASRDTFAAIGRLLRQPRLWLLPRATGVFVTVLHFDHLLRIARKDSARGTAPLEVVEERVKRLYETITVLQRILVLESTTFDDVKIEA